MLNLPLVLQSTLTAAHNHGSEAYKVRLVFPRSQSRGPLKVYGHANNYEALFDATVGRHICEIPLTVWMSGAPAVTGAYSDNLSICTDIAKGQAKRDQKLVHQVWPWTE